MPASVFQNMIRTPAYPWLLDEVGFVSAGHVLKLIDIVGSEAALHHLNAESPTGLVVTASMDQTIFHQPIRLWDMIALKGEVCQVWRHSMEVRVSVCAQNFISGKSRDIATSYLVFVALDAKTRQKITFPPYKPSTPEGIELATAADLRKETRDTERKSLPFIPLDETDQSEMLSMQRLMSNDDANAQSNVFGGVILSIMDEIGSQAARRQALDQPIVGICQDRMSFIAPTFIGETVEVNAIVTQTWHSSMEVQVEVNAINPNQPTPRRVASSYLVFVCLGPNLRPGALPPWIPKTERQKQRAEYANRRYEVRQQTRESS